ncbi:MAG: hypothetical protein ABII12_11470 [Planctomycetota bacterium]
MPQRIHFHHVLLLGLIGCLFAMPLAWTGEETVADGGVATSVEAETVVVSDEPGGKGERDGDERPRQNGCAIISAMEPDCCIGDTNNDGVVNADDIQGFVDIHISQTWEFPQRCRADMNEDDLLTDEDIEMFVDCLVNIELFGDGICRH